MCVCVCVCVCEPFTPIHKHHHHTHTNTTKPTHTNITITLPTTPRTPVKLPLVEGQQVWPTVADLNTRLRRLVSAYLKSQRQQVLKMEKMKKQQARREKEKEASRQRELKRAELAQKCVGWCAGVWGWYAVCRDGVLCVGMVCCVWGGAVL